MDEFGLIEQFKAGPATSVAEVLARAAVAPDRAEIEQAVTEQAAADARVEQYETRMMLNRQMGDPIGHVSRCQALVGSCREEVDDLEARLKQAQGRLRRAAESLVGWQEQAEQVMIAARRESDDPLTQASRRAHELFKSVTRAKVAELTAGTPRQRRPKGPGGLAVRSEVTCAECIKCGFTPEQSFEVHHTDADGNPLAGADSQAQADAEAGRYQPVRAGAREISR